MKRLIRLPALGALIVGLASQALAADVQGVINKLKNPQERFAAQKELEKLGPEASAELKSVAFNKSEDERVRAAVLVQLGKMKDASARQGLENTLQSDRSSICRMAAAMALGELKDKNSIPVLKKAMKEDPEGANKMYAALALAKMGDHAGKQPALTMLDSSDVNGQMVAVQVLEEVGDKKLIPQLKTKHKSETNRWKRLHLSEAVYSLEMRGMTDSEKIAYLKKVLETDEYLMAQQWAAERLAQMGTDDAMTALREVSNNTKSKGAYAATKTLRILGR